MPGKREEKQMKEIVIIVIILIMIFGGAIYNKKYLEKSTGELLGKLGELKKDIISEQKNDRNRIIEKSEKIRKDWDKTENVWGIVVSHGELDLIETSLVKMNANINSGEIKEALEELEEAEFLINHINEKEKLSLKNIF